MTVSIIYKTLYNRIVAEFLETKGICFLKKTKNVVCPHSGILCRCLKKIKIKISVCCYGKISRLYGKGGGVQSSVFNGLSFV